MYKKLRKPTINNGIIGIICGVIIFGVVFGINCAARGSEITGGDIVCFLISGVALLAALFFTIYIAVGFDIKPMKKTIQQNSWLEEEVEQDLKSGFSDKGILIGRKYIAFNTGWKCHIYLARDVIWAYQFTHTTVHKYYGIIKMGETKQYQVVLVLRDGSTRKIPVQSPEKAQELLGYLKQHYPHVVLGYSEKIQELCTNNFKEFVRLVDERATQA